MSIEVDMQQLEPVSPWLGFFCTELFTSLCGQLFHSSPDATAFTKQHILFSRRGISIKHGPFLCFPLVQG